MSKVVRSVPTTAGPLDLDHLATIHAERRLSLCTPDGGAVFVTVENPVDERPGPSADDAHALVTEMLRLARVGQRCERLAAQGD